jgi:hypothetical protein
MFSRELSHDDPLETPVCLLLEYMERLYLYVEGWYYHEEPSEIELTNITPTHINTQTTTTNEVGSRD